MEEQLKVQKRTVETGRVHIRTVVDERLARVSEVLEREDVSIERVAVNREVTHPPEVREENGVLIVPVCEEVLVVERRLVVKEELHIRKNRERERFEEAVRLRGTHVEIERVSVPPAEGPAQAAADASLVSERSAPQGSLATRARLHRKPPLRPKPK